MGKAALDPPRHAAVEPDRARERLERKAPVVADDHERAAARG
jgi:hypothetical protein